MFTGAAVFPAGQRASESVSYTHLAGEKKEYEDGITVAKLIELENVETPQYVTVTLNDEFLQSGTFEQTVLKDSDSVEFLYFMGGGAF